MSSKSIALPHSSADNEAVQIHLKNNEGQSLPRMDIDPDQPPRMVPDSAASDSGSEMYLQWDGAIDDEGHLRQCPACSCNELFVRKDVPQVTTFTLIVLAAVISAAFFAADKVIVSIVVLLVVILVDVLIYFFAGRTLVCYRCRSEFEQLPIASTQKPWEAQTGERYRKDALGTPREKLHATRSKKQTPAAKHT